AGASGTPRGSGGMASKLAAAQVAAWAGVRAVMASAESPSVVLDAIAGKPVGTVIRPRQHRLPSRKLWIAFAQGASGRVIVDDGARRALTHDGRSLLPAGVRGVDGRFEADEAVGGVGEGGRPFAKGLARVSGGAPRTIRGPPASELPHGTPHEVIHRDDLVVLP